MARSHTALISIVLLCAVLPSPVAGNGRPADSAPAYRWRWLYPHGYAAVERDGGFTFVYFDDHHGPAKPYSEVHWSEGGLWLRRWRGGSGWNHDWQYTAVRLPPRFLRDAGVLLMRGGAVVSACLIPDQRAAGADRREYHPRVLAHLAPAAQRPVRYPAGAHRVARG